MSFYIVGTSERGGRFGLQTIHKCASTSIQNTLGQNGKWFSAIDVNAYSLLKDRYVFMRHPWERCVSVYRMYKRTGSSWRHDLTNLDNFVQSICKPRLNSVGGIQSDGSRDPHTMHQYSHMMKGGTFLPTEIIRWDFKRLAELLDVDEVLRQNVGYRGNNPEFAVDVSHSSEAEALYRDWYAQDFKLWENEENQDGRYDTD